MKTRKEHVESLKCEKIVGMAGIENIWFLLMPKLHVQVKGASDCRYAKTYFESVSVLN